MNAAELHQQITSVQDRDIEDMTLFPEFEVVTAINFGQGADEQRMSIELVIWDHDKKQLVLLQE